MRRLCVGLLALLLLLPGCWSRVEINDLAIISLVAVDRAGDDSLELFVQIVLPSRIARPGGGGGGGGGRAVHMISSTGRTVLDAARKLQLRTPRRLFWDHANVILLGEALAREGLEQVEDFLTRYSDMRIRSQIFLVRGDLRQALSVTPALERIPTDFIRELGREHAGLMMTLREFMRDRKAQGKDAVLPVLDLVEAEDPGAAPEEVSGAFRLGGAALLQGDRLVAFLGQREMRVLMWLMGKKTRGVMTIESPERGGQISVELSETTVERRVVWQGQRPQIQIKISVETELEDVASPLDITDERILSQIEAALQDRAATWIRVVLERMSEEAVDPAGFGQLIRRSNFRVWRQLRPVWREEISELPVSFQVRMNIERTGLARQSRSVPEEEVWP